MRYDIDDIIAILYSITCTIDVDGKHFFWNETESKKRKGEGTKKKQTKLVKKRNNNSEKNWKKAKHLERSLY